jgi:cyclophilin family peptidyl-prolyl cis-trans isomerase
MITIHFQKILSMAVLTLIFLLLTGCAAAPPPFEHQVEVRSDSGSPIAEANVTAEIALRYAVHGTTGTDGTVTLAFDPDQLQVDTWTKITVEAAGYPPVSVLDQMEEDGPPTIVTLGQTGAPTEAPAAAESPAPTTERALAAVPPAQRADYFSARPPMTIDPTKTYRATIKTSKGDIVVSLNAQAAPEHVNNFIFLANQGFYDGLTFHRVEPGFVIQGGDPLGSGQGGPGYKVPGEFSLKHSEGALAMARLGDAVNPQRESSGSQFYITLAPAPFLDDQYSVFGQVEQGMDVVKAIQVGDTIERVTIDQ